MKYEKIIKELLRKRGFESETEMEEFLNPSLDSFHNPFLLNDMDRAVERIHTAIEKKERIVIYGDYDCDGISAVSVLYLFLSSRGVDVRGFIPSRHTDGYGLSEETVHRIKSEFNPALVITVDTGISAWNEINMFHELGIDTIVTDHHEPPEKLPSTIVIDPKIKGQAYPFNGLSGAGVAFKLVQALSSLDEALKFIDIVAISTVGDIVPLLDENRLIVKMGLEKINSKTPRPSIGYLKSKLKLGFLTSTDISFKIVPRLNASGRISTAEKCFNFMIETNANNLERLFDEIERDNNERLSLSARAFEKIDEIIKSIDLNIEPAVFVFDEEINLGIIGIVASRLVNIINRPVFIFTKDESGQLKASVRSVEGIDIFKILDKYRNLMVDVGGHSMAGGLTIIPENFSKLKSAVNEELKNVDFSLFKSKKHEEYDLEIKVEDINLEFAKELEKLEPFGFQNPRPQFKLKTNTTNYTQLKSPKHFKIGVGAKKEIMSFFGETLVPYFKTDADKELIITIEVDRFFTSPRAKAMLKCLTCENYAFADDDVWMETKELYYYSKSCERTELLEEKIDYQPFGIAVITDNYVDAREIQKKTGYKIVLEPEDSGESVIIYNPHRVIDETIKNMYKLVEVRTTKSLVYFLNSLGINVVDHAKEWQSKFKLTRDKFKDYYIIITKNMPIDGNSEFEIIEKLSSKTKLSPLVVGAVVFVSEELGFYNNVKTDLGVQLSVNTNSKKRMLDESKIYKRIS